eukprot:58648_1
MATIGHLGRQFTLDNDHIITWQRNLRRAKSNFRRQISIHFNNYHNNNFIKRINPAASILKRAYSYLDSSINNLINNRMSRKYFHPFHYARKRNHDQQTHSTLQSIKMSNITIAQVDKNMGDIAIPRSRLDAVVLEHLNGSNYTPLFESEYIISTRIRNNVIQLKDKHESYLGETFALSRKFIALKFKILKEINNNDWTPLPTMRPMIKIHKATEKWRYITNPGDFYTGMHSSWTNDECMGLTALLMVKYDKEFILENSADYVNSLGDLPQLKPNHWRFSIDMDVKSLYDSMDLMQCMNIIINTIKREIPRYNPYRLDHLEDIIILFQQNTVVKWRLMNGEIVIFKMISGVGTGYSHSGGLANLTLLCYELTNYHTMQSAILIQIHLFRRYIDDLRIICDADMQQFRNDKNRIINHVKTTMVPQINGMYPQNLELTAEFGNKGIFLDTYSVIASNGIVHTSIYEKPLNRHISLHWLSNNPINQKISPLISQLYRSIIINDRKADHTQFKSNVIKRLSNRGYPGSTLRHAMKKNNIPKYEHRQELLRKAKLKHEQRYWRRFISARMHILDDMNMIKSDHEIMEIKAKFNIKDEDDTKKDIYFILLYEQLFDDEHELRRILNEFHKLLPDGYRDSIEFTLCSKLPNKIGAFLN